MQLRLEREGSLALANRNCDNCESLRKAAWDRINELESKLEEREWVGLTDEEVRTILDDNTRDNNGFEIWCNGAGVARAIIAKLKEKNT